MGTHLKTTERHLLYGIKQCYLPPYTDKRAQSQPHPDKLVLDLPTPEG